MALPANKIKKIKTLDNTTYDIVPEMLGKDGYSAELPTLTENSTIALTDYVVANPATTTASLTGITINGTSYAVSSTDNDHYPTTFTWTNGTTAGPTGSLTGNSGFTAISFDAIPAASLTQSGILTTDSTQIIPGKYFNGSIRILSTDSNALVFQRSAKYSSIKNQSGFTYITLWDNTAQNCFNSSFGSDSYPTKFNIRYSSTNTGTPRPFITDTATSTNHDIAFADELPPTITITATSGYEAITDGTNTLTFGSNAFNSTSIPINYLVSASASGNTLTITPSSGNDITFTPTFTEAHVGDVVTVGATSGSNIAIAGTTANPTIGVASGYSIPSTTDQTAWSAKYDKPSGGIPDSDLSSSFVKFGTQNSGSPIDIQYKYSDVVRGEIEIVTASTTPQIYLYSRNTSGNISQMASFLPDALGIYDANSNTTYTKLKHGSIEFKPNSSYTLYLPSKNGTLATLSDMPQIIDLRS